MGMSAEQFAVLSIEPRATELEKASAKCRAAYTKGPLYVGANLIADAYDEAARVLRAHVGALNTVIHEDAEREAAQKRVAEADTTGHGYGDDE